MTITTHAIAGLAATLALRGNPALALVAALGSHYVLDAIPHWHYKLTSLNPNPDAPLGFRMRFDKSFLRDFVYFGADGLLAGVLAALALFNFPPAYFLLGVSGFVLAVLPDFFQFAYYLFEKGPIKYHQIFHIKVHAKKRLDDNPLLGIGSQVIIVLLSLLLIFYL